MNSRLNKYLVIALAIFCFSCTGKNETPFTFVQLCDTQLGMGGYKQDVERFEQAVKQINKLNPDFVTICGDLVDIPNDTSYADFERIKSGFTMPCYCVPGNHDIENIPNDTTLTYYRKTIGKDYYTFHNNNYSFIVTNSLLWKTNIGIESDKHDAWFKETLMNESKEKQVFVIGHYPLFTESLDEEENYFDLPIEKRKELLQLFSQNNVIAYLSGHTHKTVINNYKNIQLVSGETTSMNFDKRPFGYRVWEVSPDTIKQHFVPLQSSLTE